MIIPIQSKQKEDTNVSWLVCKHLADMETFMRYYADERTILIIRPFVLCEECHHELFTEGTLGPDNKLEKLTHKEIEGHLEGIGKYNNMYINKFLETAVLRPIK